MGWISMCDWRTFQHYDPAKRQPPWIKNYTELMTNEAYLRLPGHTRSILHGLWLEYASSRCRLRADSSSLSSRLHLRVLKSHLDSLCDAGFIEIVASAALAEGYQSASSHARPRARVETETETENLVGKQAVLSYAADEPANEPGLPTGNGLADEGLVPLDVYLEERYELERQKLREEA